MDLANLCRAAFNGLRSLNRSLEGPLYRRARYVIQMKVILPNPLYGTVHIGHRIFVNPWASSTHDEAEAPHQRTFVAHEAHPAASFLSLRFQADHT